MASAATRCLRGQRTTSTQTSRGRAQGDGTARETSLLCISAALAKGLLKRN